MKNIAPKILLDLRYATKNNFTKQVLYPTARCYLRQGAARALAAVQKRLEKRGLGLKIFDCYRPLSTQKTLWSFLPDSRYVARPEKGSRHNRGAAVDLTLVNAEGKELTMPTAYDAFGVKASRFYLQLPKEALANRQLLENLMIKQGFIGLPTEWWHFDYHDWKKYPLSDYRWWR